jgi:hypothetical protein
MNAMIGLAPGASQRRAFCVAEPAMNRGKLALKSDGCIPSIAHAGLYFRCI